MLAAVPLISEFLASNDSGREDVDGEASDWIELHNAGDMAADLGGWYLTDDQVDLTKWQFPAVTLPPGGYLVVFASDKDRTDPAAELHANFRLAAGGEYLALVRPDGTTVAHEYAPQFPQQATDVSYGIEMMARAVTFVAEGASARYLIPTSGSLGLSWTQRGFNDIGWSAGEVGLGYETSGNNFAPHLQTRVPSGTTSVYLRQKFTVEDRQSIAALTLGLRYDDGVVVYLNGQRVAARNAPANAIWNSTATTTHNDSDAEVFEPIDLADWISLLVDGENVLALHALNQSSNSSDMLVEARLTGTVAGELGGVGYLVAPTPGTANGSILAGLGPIAGDVVHAPFQPANGQAVTVTAEMSDPQGVASVVLEYQVVAAGSYISIDDPAYETSWTAVAMRDDGTQGDAAADDGVYAAVIPASVQQHRNLVRYRLRAEDGEGFESLSPNQPEASPNFAYFVYDGVPDWRGAARPGVTQTVTYSSELLTSVPVYHLITKRQDVLDAQFHPGTTRGSGYTGSDYLWEGTLVYDGVVYDHIRYRARGGVWRYAMGKNMWKFAFNNEERFQAYDNYGRPYATRWDNLNFSAIIQQGDYLHRGEQGLFESVGFRLFQLAGVEAPNTHYVHFRVIDEAAETGNSQFAGDFWGLYVATEQVDERFLEEHGLVDGNIFKMEGGTGPGGIGGVLEHQGAGLPGDYSDLQAFKQTYEQGTQTADWWRENLDLDRYYSYRAIVEAIHHYDVGYGKNYYYVHNAETGQWQVHPWDIDLTWADNMFGDGNEPFRSRVLAIGELSLEYRNRLREIRDLLYNSEQTGLLIDEMAAIVYAPGERSLVDADRAMWDYNPILASGNVNANKAGHGRFYQRTPSRDFPGMMQLMKNYVASRSSYIDRTLLTDENRVPRRPTIQYTGDAAHPLDGLTFGSSAFSSPVGAAFDAIEWRIAEVSDPSSPTFDPSQPRHYEIEANWQSGPLDQSGMNVAISPVRLEAGHLYRVRARVRDDDGRWSHWSEPIQFVAGAAEATLSEHLRVSEINYHPHDADSNAGELPADDNDFEFVELINTHPAHALDLAGVRFVEGIEFEFTSGAIELPAGGRVVVVRDIDAFESRYGSGIFVAGEYSGALSNDGEALRLVDALGASIQEFAYDDSAASWPASADGLGGTLVVLDMAGNYDSPANWASSGVRGGTPGAAEPATGLDGDYNGNGTVEQADLDLVLLYWGQAAANAPPAWINNRPSGVIDQAELDAVLLNWGATLGNIAATRVAPVAPAPLEADERSNDTDIDIQTGYRAEAAIHASDFDDFGTSKTSSDYLKQNSSRVASARASVFAKFGV
jgi:hypothetical protein